MSLQLVTVVSGPQISAELIDRQAGDRVLRVDDDGQGVVRDLDLLVLDAALLAEHLLLGSIAREASLKSVSPAQNFSKPPPVPEVPTVTLTSGFSCWKPSATASVSGATVLEPSIRIVPDRPDGVSPLSAVSVVLSSSPQAATPSASRPVHAPMRELAWVHWKLTPC